MSKAREMAEIISTPPSIYSTDAEVAATYLTQASASTIYKGSNFRNLIINGAMNIAQRATSVAGITNSSVYSTADRWKFPTDNGTWTQSVENDAPTGSGFRKSLKVLCTSGASPSAAQLTYVSQTFEGQNLQQILKGTSSAKQLTLSFWVKTNVTGTYVIWVYDVDNDRQICSSYTVSASATWEKKTVTFAADTTGAFDNDNAASLIVGWHLSAGSNYTTGTLPTTWQSYNAVNRAVGQTNIATTNSYWQVTGVQLEVGPVATDFEFKPFAQDLAECQRYYHLQAKGFDKPFGMGYNYQSTQAIGSCYLPVPMRTTPTSASLSGTNYYGLERNGGFDYFNSITMSAVSNETMVVFNNNTQISGTAGDAGLMYTGSVESFIAFQAEL
jgi:hypothetical protein